MDVFSGCWFSVVYFVLCCGKVRNAVEKSMDALKKNRCSISTAFFFLLLENFLNPSCVCMCSFSLLLLGSEFTSLFSRLHSASPFAILCRTKKYMSKRIRCLHFVHPGFNMHFSCVFVCFFPPLSIYHVHFMQSNKKRATENNMRRSIENEKKFVCHTVTQHLHRNCTILIPLLYLDFFPLFFNLLDGEDKCSGFG